MPTYKGVPFGTTEAGLDQYKLPEGPAPSESPLGPGAGPKEPPEGADYDLMASEAPETKKKEEIGNTVGSGVGTAAGTLLGGPMGGALGGALGGAVGGAVGGMNSIPSGPGKTIESGQIGAGGTTPEGAAISVGQSLQKLAVQGMQQKAPVSGKGKHF